MVDTVVFSGIGALDFQEIRINVLRIPEVSRRISQAQALWDQKKGRDLNFINFIMADNEMFLSTIGLKSLVSAIVQVGLYDRYSKKFDCPQYMVGNSKGDSALKVCTGQQTFEELVLNSSSIKGVHPDLQLRVADGPLLTGHSLASYAVYYRSNHQAGVRWAPMSDRQINIEAVMTDLVEKHKARKVINIGPGHCLLQPIRDRLAMWEVQILDSVELDPLLTWFWRSVEDDQKLAMAT